MKWVCFPFFEIQKTLALPPFLIQKILPRQKRKHESGRAKGGPASLRAGRAPRLCEVRVIIGLGVGRNEF
ncbi:MAG: hypothetical protein Q8P01_04865 [bacterium]|nr:hypothetical protein [bacterium]